MDVSNCPAGLGWLASFPRFRVSGAPSLAATEFTEKWNAILFERMNGNGKLTETEKVSFYVSYRFLRNSWG